LNAEKPSPAEPVTPEPSESFRGKRPDRDQRGFDSPRPERPSHKDRGPRDMADSKPRPQRPEPTRGDVNAVSEEPGMIRLALNVGREHRIGPADIVGVMVNLGKLPKAAVGAIHLFPRESFVDVSDDFANRLMKKLNGIRFKGYELAIGRAS
jgi:ATP-dependent RNA helicase DeaD